MSRPRLINVPRIRGQAAPLSFMDKAFRNSSRTVSIVASGGSSNPTGLAGMVSVGLNPGTFCPPRIAALRPPNGRLIDGCGPGVDLDPQRSNGQILATT